MTSGLKRNYFWGRLRNMDIHSNVSRNYPRQQAQQQLRINRLFPLNKPAKPRKYFWDRLRKMDTHSIVGKKSASLRNLNCRTFELNLFQLLRRKFGSATSDRRRSQPINNRTAVEDCWIMLVLVPMYVGTWVSCLFLDPTNDSERNTHACDVSNILF